MPEVSLTITVTLDVEHMFDALAEIAQSAKGWGRVNYVVVDNVPSRLVVA